MNQVLSCREVELELMVERYLADRLAGPELDRFESHLFECDRCLGEVRLGAGLRRELGPPTGTRSGSSAVRRWLAAAGIVAAAAVTILVLRPGSFDESALQGLGAVPEAPLYLGLPARTEPGAADSLFEAAMTYYAARDFRHAADELRRALAAGVDAAPAEFFLASALLMLSDPAGAADSYGRVIELGLTPYRAEAHLYRAKARLRLGDATGALEDLGAVSAAAPGGTTASHAAALADSVRAARGD